MATTQTPSTEQLALSASVFTSSIDAWIPAKFGPQTSDTDREADFAKRLREAALQGENERLGLGHPDIGVHKPRGPSLSALEKKLGKVDRKGKQREQPDGVNVKPNGVEQAGEESDEGESRARSLGVKKKVKAGGVQDLFSGKKKKAKAVTTPVHPLLNLGQGASASMAPPAPQETEVPADVTSSSVTGGSKADPQAAHTPLPAASSPGGSGDFPFTGPIAPRSPLAKKVLLNNTNFNTNTGTNSNTKGVKRAREAEPPAILNLSSTPASVDDDETETRGEGGLDAEADEDKGMSKSQRRREARKRAKRVKRDIS